MLGANEGTRDTLGETVRALASGVGALTREFAPVLRGLNEFAVRLEPLTRSLAAAAPLVQAVAPVMRRWGTAESLLKRGWVPSHTTPFGLVAECGDDDVKLTRSLLSYYTDNWSEVRTQLETRLSSHEIDEEAKATFREALDAHEAGLYRSVSRVLFPEFERLFRVALFDGRAGQKPYKTFVKKLSGEAANLDLADFLIAGIQDIVLFKYLTEGITGCDTSGNDSGSTTPEYFPGLAVGVDETNVERARRSPIPTRHAVAHGLVAYSSQHSSLNALFIAGYIFSVVSQVFAARQIPIRVM